jgi:DNA-directed RNA polymerase subunit RPC12/RpoP
MVMKFEAATCPSCGAPIQVPTDVEVAKCMYCGSNIMVKDVLANIKAEVSGSIRDSMMESMLKGAETFLKQGNWAEAHALYTNMTTQDPADYRGWWGSFLVKTQNLKLYNKLGFVVDLSDAKTAIELAPESAKSELNKIFREYESNGPKIYHLKIILDHIDFLQVLITGTGAGYMKDHTQASSPILIEAPEGEYMINLLTGNYQSTFTATFEMHDDVSFNVKKNFMGKLAVDVQGATRFNKK